MSFAKELAETAIQRAKAIQDIQMREFREFEKKKQLREDELMNNLTNKYHPLIKKALWDAALIHGNREKYMNFDYNDFKANFPTLGNPVQVCSRWLTEMTNEDSQYLPYKPVPCWDSTDVTDLSPREKDHFAGLQFDVRGNGAFTVQFKW